MGKTLGTMVDGKETLIRHPVSLKEKPRSFSETIFYRLLTDPEARKEYVTGIKVKIIEFFYHAPKII